MRTAKTSKKKTSAIKEKSSNSVSKSYMTSSEACAYLNIKPQTLYAYVSRGQLRAEPRSDDQSHQYHRDDIEALRLRSIARSGHGPVAGAAMRWGEPILDSAITNIQNGMLYYRGHSLDSLLQDGRSFENVSELLWSGELPVAEVFWPNEPIRSAVLKEKPPATQDRGSSIARRLACHLTEVALSDQMGHDELLDESLRRARRLIMSTAMKLFHMKKNPGKKINPKGSIAKIISEGIGVSESALAVQAINAALIVSADHELNASTFAARITASTGADLYACIQAGVSAFSGRHHGLASIEVYDFITGMLASGDCDKYLIEIGVKGRAVPGFGHSLYPLGDPRASQLIDRAYSLAKERGAEADKYMQMMTALITAARKQSDLFPNLDLGLVAIALALGLSDVGASSLFALGRMAGWTAHIMEQRQQGFLLRPRARYVGRLPLSGPS